MIEVLTFLASLGAVVGTALARRDIRNFRTEVREMIQGVVRQEGPVSAQVTAATQQEKRRPAKRPAALTL